VRTGLAVALRRYADAGGAVMLVTHDHEFAASTCDVIAVVKGGRIDRSGPVGAMLEAAAGHAATNIYTFPSFYLDRAVRRRSKLPAERS
jgi:ABC-type sulfate/molybdate transport systems ATPase subunit